MKKELIRIDISGMSREEWLMERRKGIGGSDAAAILGLSKWQSPTSLYMDKLGLLPEQEETEALRVGRDLEQYVADRFTEVSGIKTRKCNFLLKDPEYPFLHANVDRELVGMDAGLECKTASAFKTKVYEGGEFPDNYYCQCVHYLSVTGKTTWFLAVLVLGIGFKIYCITRDMDYAAPDWCESCVYVEEEEITALRKAEVDFWRCYIIPKSPPPLDGSEATTDALNAVQSETSEDGSCDLLGCERMLEVYLQITSDIASLETEREKVKQALMQEMGAFTHGECEGYSVSYKPQTRTTFDWKLFKRENPHFDLAPYFKSSNSRPLKVTALK